MLSRSRTGRVILWELPATPLAAQAQAEQEDALDDNEGLDTDGQVDLGNDEADPEEQQCVCERDLPEYLLHCDRCGERFHPGCQDSGRYRANEYEEHCTEEDFKRDADKFKNSAKKFLCIWCSENALFAQETLGRSAQRAQRLREREQRIALESRYTPEQRSQRELDLKAAKSVNEKLFVRRRWHATVKATLDAEGIHNDNANDNVETTPSLADSSTDQPPSV